MALAIDPALPQADIVTIKRMIPHRYPFLMIDRVVNIEVNRYAVGIKNVTVNEPHFEGHFPVHPGDAGRADHRGDGADLARCWWSRRSA